MPVLRIYGMPNDVDQEMLENLLDRLQKAAAAPLGISQGEVSVFFPMDLVKRGLGEELICVVDGLFEKPEGTIEIRRRLAGSILGPLEGFAAQYLPQCAKVEAIVNRFDQYVDGFATCDPREH